MTLYVYLAFAIVTYFEFMRLAMSKRKNRRKRKPRIACLIGAVIWPMTCAMLVLIEVATMDDNDD